MSGFDIDIAGSDRIQGCDVDMGIYEMPPIHDHVCMQINKTVAPDVLLPNQAVTYTLEYENSRYATLTANDVVITDHVPVSVTLTSVSFSGATITETQPGYVWAVDALSPGEGGIITITGVISASVPASIITNTAVITSSSSQLAVKHNTSTATLRVATVIYVNTNVVGGEGNGSSWSDAFDNLQDALTVAVSNDEIWVAAGQYFPDEGSDQVNDDIESTFNLIDGVSVYGGFSGNRDCACRT